MKPRLRFKEFNYDWEEKTLDSVTDVFKSGQGITSENISNTGVYPVYGGNGLRGFTDRYTHDGFYVLIGRQGALCGNINTTDGKSYISEHAIAVKANSESSTQWLAYKLNLMNLNRLSESSAQPGLAVNKLLKLKLFLPLKREQTKIASFMSAVDEKISQLTKKHELLTQYKKGVMQKIFSQELRFKGDDGSDYPDWEVQVLSDIGTSFNGLTGKTAQDFGVGDHYVTYKQIFDSSKVDSSKFGSVTIKKNEKQNQIKYGDLFFTTSSETPEEVGYCSVMLENVDRVYLNSFCFGFRINSFNVLMPEFARFLFFSPKMRESIVLLAQGSTRYNISKTAFLKIKASIPSVSEQTKIASFLTAIDDKIQSTKSQIEATKQYKQGLLQQMFV